MGLLLVLAFIVVPIVELYVIIQVGQAIGVLPTIALLILDAVIGAALVRREGRKTWAAFRAATEASRIPAKEVGDGALVIFGGALLMAPGFSTDILGLLCVLPPSRGLLRRWATRAFTRRLGIAGIVGPAVGRARGPARPGGGGVVDGTVVEGTVVEGTVADDEDDPPDRC